MIYRNFSKRQILAMTWWNRPGLGEREGIICHGAVRSGKTVAMADGFFLWSMGLFHGCTFGICGKTIGALRRNVIDNLPAWLGDTFTVTQQRSENKLILESAAGHRNTYYLFGGQDESACKLIQGITLAGVLLDEAAIMPRSFVEQACARCSLPGSKLWFNCNPEGPEHWFYKEWIQKAEQKNLLLLHFTMQDNPGLSPRIRRRYESLYAGVFYRRFVLGQWCVAEGLVYDFQKERHLTRDIPGAGKYYISVDYGTCNPFSAGVWCVTDTRAVRLGEYYYDGRTAGRTLTDEEYYAALEKLAGQYPISLVVVDPSAASFLTTIRRHGKFSVRKAKNAVIPGIQLVSRLLKAGVLQFSPQCTNTVREFSLYRWAPEGDGVIKENDHAMDDIRYFCATVLHRNTTLVEGGSYEEMADRAVSPPVGKGNGPEGS